MNPHKMMHVNGSLAAVRNNNIHDVGKFLGLSALMGSMCLVVLYIGKNMGPPRWKEQVAVWMMESNIHNRDFYVRLCRMENLSKDEIRLCAMSGCIAAKCLVIQNPTVSARCKEGIYRQALRDERYELQQANRTGELDSAIHEMGDDSLFRKTQDWLRGFLGNYIKWHGNKYTPSGVEASEDRQTKKESIQ